VEINPTKRCIKEEKTELILEKKRLFFNLGGGRGEVFVRRGGKRRDWKRRRYDWERKKGKIKSLLTWGKFPSNVKKGKVRKNSIRQGKGLLGKKRIARKEFAPNLGVYLHP